MRKAITALFTFGMIAGMAGPAAAYVGPGAGLSLLGALWGLLIAVFAALGFIIFWPLRRMLKRGRGNAPAATAEGDTVGAPDASSSTRAQS